MANLLKYSQHLLHSINASVTATLPWYRNRMDAANTAETSYYGHSPVVRVTSNINTNVSHQMQQSIGTHNGGVVVSVSVTCKYVNLPFIAIGFYDGSWKLQGFDLTTSGVGTSPTNVSNAGVDDLGGGIVRIYASYTMPATSELLIGFVLVKSLSPTTDAVVLASGSGVDIHGIQAEVGAVTDYEGTTWGETTAITAFSAGATALWSATSTWQAGESPLPGDTVSLNTASGTGVAPAITIDTPEINCKVLAFNTANGCRLVIVNDCTIYADTTLVGVTGTYCSGYYWNGGNLTFEGAFSWFGAATASGSTVNTVNGVINRSGSFPSGELTFNAPVSLTPYTNYSAHTFFISNNSNLAAVDAITFNSTYSRGMGTSSAYGSIIHYGASVLDVTFNGAVYTTGYPTTTTHLRGAVYRVNDSGVLRATFNGLITAVSGVYGEDSGVDTAEQNGISPDLIINSSAYVRSDNNYTIAFIKYVGKVILGADVVLAQHLATPERCAMRIDGTAVLQAHPTSVITSLVSRKSVPVVELNNSQSHTIGILDTSMADVPSQQYTVVMRNAPLVLWSPALPAATCGLSILRVVTGLSTGVYVGGTIDPLEIVVDEIVSVDPALATGWLWCPGIFSENPYCRIRFKTMISYQFGGWAVAGLVEPFDSLAQWIIYDRFGSQRVMRELDLGTIPSSSDVRSGVAVGSSTGTLVVPLANTVQQGITYDNDTVGTLAVIPTLPTDYTDDLQQIKNLVVAGLK